MANCATKLRIQALMLKGQRGFGIEEAQQGIQALSRSALNHSQSAYATAAFISQLNKLVNSSENQAYHIMANLMFKENINAFEESLTNHELKEIEKLLGASYQEYVETMQYQYGLDENTARIYAQLYLRVATSDKMINKSDREIACEVNRIIASLCLNYDGDATRWKMTVGNYKSQDVYQMLIDKYNFSKADAIDFAIALNVQHGTPCEKVESEFGFSRLDGNNYTDKVPATKDFQMRSAKNGADITKDFVHEAVQYVEFNDKWDVVDVVSGSTDRMISYSGDIISRRYDNSDFLTDIDANNIQKRYTAGNDSFLKTQFQYNNEVMDGKIDPKKEFIENNGSVDKIRNNINYDIRSDMGAYIDNGKKGIIFNGILFQEIRVNKYKENVNDFIDFLEN